MKEPSVLDYIKAKLAPGKYPDVTLPEIDSEASDEQPEQRTPGEHLHPATVSVDEEPSQQGIEPGEDINETKTRWPWLSLAALVLAILAQYSLEPGPARSWIPGLILFTIGITIAAIAGVRSEWQLPPYKHTDLTIEDNTVKVYPLIAGLVVAGLSFLTFQDNHFSILNISLLLFAIILLLWAFWVPGGVRPGIKDIFNKINRNSRLSLSIPSWWVVLALSIILVAFFRYYRLDQVPLEMNSDHAEKILDVLRVLDGQTMIFFPTNGGREALQFYLVAGLHKIFGAALDFSALKMITISVGFLSLPFIYLLGKDLVNKRVGLFGMLLAGVAYWPNVVSRAGMRLPFYILFTAMTMFLLVRGIRTGKRNYFILCGLTVGLSLYGYSADRILPVLVIAAGVIYLVHRHPKHQRVRLISSLVILFIFAAVIFLPMLHYMIDDPDSFLFRTLTRMGTLERELPAAPISLFFTNLRNALFMFSWDNGEIWPVSIPHRPALDVITGALFILGITLMVVRYIKNRTWIDLFLLLSIPILLMPSVMSLAFPAENPNLYRTGGAMIPVFIIIAICLEGLFASISIQFGRFGRRLAWSAVILLVGISAFMSYDLVFNQYDKQYSASAWNSSEMSEVVRGFTDSVGKIENVWVMAYPHWVDTRLIGMLSGYPLRDFVLFPEQLESLPANQEAKLFLIKPEDESSKSLLQTIYPQGWFQEYTSQSPNKNFIMFFVPQTN